jgi:peptide/nickel transport system permease protein
LGAVAVDRVASLRSHHPLAAYALRRLGIALLLAVLVSVLVFAATQVLPGNTADAILGRTATAEQKAIYTKQLGLDKPLWEQYWSWFSGVLHGDLGRSVANQQTVSSFISARLSNSLILAGATLLFLIPGSVILGAWAGVRRGKAPDHAISGISLGLIALPEFVTGTILAAIVAVSLKLVPPTSIIPIGDSPLSQPSLLVLPVITLCLAGCAYIVRMLRAGVIESMSSDYVQAARLNGINERRVIFRHALRNSLAPTVQVVALTVQWLIGGIVVVETVFSYPGLGAGLVGAVTGRDIPVVQSVTLILALVYIVINLIADLVVVLLVPKLRTSVS